MNKITIKNPSAEIIHQIGSDIRAAIEQEVSRTFQRASLFLSGSESGKKTFRTGQLQITVEKPKGKSIRSRSSKS